MAPGRLGTAEGRGSALDGALDWHDHWPRPSALPLDVRSHVANGRSNPMPRITRDQIAAYVLQMQALRSELAEVEAKDGRRGLPVKIYETLSALANRRGGGTIIFGLEDATFRPVGGLDIARLQELLASFVDQKMSYPIRLDFVPCDLSGVYVLGVAVDECPLPHKPVWYKGKGLIGGSYLRVGNTSHQLSEAEVRAILRSSDRDDTDSSLVEGASKVDLAPDLITDYRGTLATRRPSSALLKMSDEDLLLAVRAAVRTENGLVPTQAGILFFADEPQRWLPGAFVSFMQFAGTEIGEVAGRASIYVDNIKIGGPVPRMLEEARRTLLSRIRRRALLEGLVRREIPEYPDWAYREAIVNAVAHRDYGVSGAHIQVRLFADRLEVQSPGGLFGTVSEQNIETEQSTRNHTVVRLLEDYGLVEQRGIGVNRMVQSMLQAGLERPIFRDALTSFQVVLRNHTMMDDDAYRWLSSFSDYRISDRQRIALVYVWRTGSLANRDYQRLNSVTSVLATRDLRVLVEQGLLRQHGTRGSAFYTLAMIPRPQRRRTGSIGAQEEMILAHVRRRGRITNGEGRQLLEIDDVGRMRQILRRMVRYGLLAQRGTSKQNTFYELGPAAGKPT